MNWIDYKKFNYYHEVEKLRDIVINEYGDIKDTISQEQTGLSVHERYGSTATDIYWYGFPLIDVEKENTDYTKYWPKTIEKLKTIPGIINACINFVGPNSRLPDHVDMDISKEKIGDRTAIGTIIGIDMPSADPAIVGFHVDNEIKGWSTGDIVCIDGYKNHGGWNKSNSWRVSLLFDTDTKFWNTL
jgi:hypothetical protein